MSISTQFILQVVGSNTDSDRTTSDLLIDLDIFQPQTLSVGDWNLEFDIWEDRLLREFAEICPTPNTFEELMLADALDMPDEAILYWCKIFRMRKIICGRQKF